MILGLTQSGQAFLDKKQLSIIMQSCWKASQVSE